MSNMHRLVVWTGDGLIPLDAWAVVGCRFSCRGVRVQSVGVIMIVGKRWMLCVPEAWVDDPGDGIWIGPIADGRPELIELIDRMNGQFEPLTKEEAP